MAVSIGDVDAALPDALPYPERFARAETNDVRCPDEAAVKRMRSRIWDTMQAKDTLGGIFEVVALGVPPGLGSHVHFDRKLDAQLAAALVSIQAIKGVEIGPAFANTRLPGTQVHDEITVDAAGDLHRTTNRAGGLEGGISTGEPIVLRAAMKPISTTLKPLQSVDLATGEPAPTRYERSGLHRGAARSSSGRRWSYPRRCAVAKLGGDSLAEQLPRCCAAAQPAGGCADGQPALAVRLRCEAG